MRVFILVIVLYLCVIPATAQRYRITFTTDEILHTDKLFINENLFRRVPNVIVDNRRIGIDTIREIHDSNLNFTYKTFRFRRVKRLARQLEFGKINLYDLHSADSRESKNTRRNSVPSNNRFYYHLAGDTVLSVLNRKNFDTLFQSKFASDYPDFKSIKKNYLRLHTTSILSSVMLPNLITVTGFQSVAILTSYVATTAYLTGASLINRKKKFMRVRNMVRDYNMCLLGN